MKVSNNFKKALLATALVTTGLLGAAGNASAYVACNRLGDCWHTDTRVHFPGVRLTFHRDNWWDQNKANHRYTWHDIDASHDWHHGYWEHGVWHTV
jgi:hypothetical protein